MKARSTNLVRFLPVLAWHERALRRLASGAMLAAAVSATPLQAQIVYDATADFSNINGNPNGVWSYGWMPTDFSVFTAYTGVFSTDNLDWWWDAIGDCPHIWKNLGTTSRAGVPPGRLSLHPGPGQEPSVLRWTSPLPGSVQIQEGFLPGNSGIMQVAVRRGGTTLWQATDSGAFALSGTVLPGDTFDFAVYGGYYSGDTALEALISLTPLSGSAIYLRRGSIAVQETEPTLALELQRFGPEHLNEEVAVDFATVDGTAHAGEDYVAASGTLHFAVGETNKQISIAMLDDTLEEREEQFRLVLSNPTGGLSLGNSNVVIRIQDNEFLFSDDFESYPTGSFPGNGWVLVYDGAGADLQRVQSDLAASGTNALRLVGQPGWAATAEAYFALPPRFTIEASVYPEKTSGHSGTVCAVNRALGPWGTSYGGIEFENGYISARLRTYTNLSKISIITTNLVPYSPNRWYRMRSVLDFSSRTFDAYVDGQLLAAGLPILDAGLPTGIDLGIGIEGFRVDDIKVTSFSGQPSVTLNPRGTWRPTTTNSVHVVQAAGTSALVGTDNGITHRLDIADPAKPVLTGTWESLVTASALCLRSNLAFIAGWELDFLSTVEVVDFADPTHPVLRDFFDTPGYAQGMAVTERHAFVADNEAGLIILDISNPAVLRQVGQYPTRGPLTRIAVSGNLACLGLEGGLVILDVTDPAKPIRVGIWSTSNPVRDVAVNGTTVFVLEAGKGLEILDVRQPGNPVLVGSHAWVMDAVAMAIQGDFVFLANGARGLQVIDVSNPAKPEWVAGYATSGSVEDVAASGNQVWVAAGAQGLLGFEFLDRRIKAQRTSGPGNNITFSWQADAGWQLQRTTNLEMTDWQVVPASEITNQITVPTGVGSGFFRLVKP